MPIYDGVVLDSDRLEFSSICRFEPVCIVRVHIEHRLRLPELGLQYYSSSALASPAFAFGREAVEEKQSKKSSRRKAVEEKQSKKSNEKGEDTGRSNLHVCHLLGVQRVIPVGTQRQNSRARPRGICASMAGGALTCLTCTVISRCSYSSHNTVHTIVLQPQYCPRHRRQARTQTVWCTHLLTRALQ